MTLEPLRCPNCGALLPAGASIEKCSFCGAVLATPAAGPAPLVVDVSAARYKETCTDIERPDLDLLKLFNPAVAVRFDELWRSVVAEWEVPAAHRAFLDYCLQNPSGDSLLQRAQDRYEALTGNRDERVWRCARAINKAIVEVVAIEIEIGMARFSWFANPAIAALAWVVPCLAGIGIVATEGSTRAAAIVAGPLVVAGAAAFFIQRRSRASAAGRRQAALADSTARLLALADNAGRTALGESGAA